MVARCRLTTSWCGSVRVALHGVDGVLVEIEAHIGPGLPGLQMVGLPDTSLSEARDRVRAAVLNSGWAPPSGPPGPTIATTAPLSRSQRPQQ